MDCRELVMKEFILSVSLLDSLGTMLSSNAVALMIFSCADRLFSAYDFKSEDKSVKILSKSFTISGILTFLKKDSRIFLASKKRKHVTINPIIETIDAASVTHAGR